ncbi:MAG: hypothetical protein K6U00_13400, partial [Armatimonadetes bacterium]|nr:hypothetical protein [Armatimonadota bacterium]
LERRFPVIRRKCVPPSGIYIMKPEEGSSAEDWFAGTRGNLRWPLFADCDIFYLDPKLGGVLCQHNYG